jgi:hypothetical protein
MSSAFHDNCVQGRKDMQLLILKTFCHVLYATLGLTVPLAHGNFCEDGNDSVLLSVPVLLGTLTAMQTR